MTLYAVLQNDKGKITRFKIAGSTIAGPKMVSQKIVRKLGIDLESNLAKMILKISEIKIEFPAGCGIRAYMTEKKYIDVFIYFTAKKEDLPKITLAQIDIDKESPEDVKHKIIDAIIACINRMGLSLEGQRGFLGRLEKMKQPFVCY